MRVVAAQAHPDGQTPAGEGLAGGVVPAGVLDATEVVIDGGNIAAVRVGHGFEQRERALVERGRLVVPRLVLVQESERVERGGLSPRPLPSDVRETASVGNS